MFRQALESRLNTEAAGNQTLLVRLRKLATFERFLIRLQSPGDDRWLLKGGFALQLRLGARARTTRDIDLGATPKIDSALSAQAIGEMLAESMRNETGDFFEFQIGPSRELALEAGPVLAYRYPVAGMLDGRIFEKFSVDAGVGDPVVGPPADLRGSGRLEFAELPAATYRAISIEQQFAEKIHALTRKWPGVENTRTRDLVDIILLMDLGLPDLQSVETALRRIFGVRSTHPIPVSIEEPPSGWKREYEVLAGELDLRQRTMESAMKRLRAYWKELAWQKK